MVQFNLRGSVAAGVVISTVMAASSGGWSKDQPRAFVETAFAGLLATLLVVVVARVIQNAGPVGASSERAYGGFWMRTAALVLDYIPLLLVGLFLDIIGLGAITVPVLFGLAVLYFIGLWTARGQTLGMGLLGLRVIQENGGNPTVIASTRRFIGLVVGIGCAFLGVAWVAFEPRKRGWADLAGGTVVVRTAH